jgi:hypothetical protein
VILAVSACLLAVTSSTDPAAATAGLRQGLSFDLVMLDAHLQYPGGGARELLEFAIREPRLCIYGNG